MGSVPNDTEFVLERPAYKQTQAKELSRIGNLKDKLFERANRRALQKSIIGGVAPKELSADTKRILELGIEAIEKVAADPIVPLTPEERGGMESVILIMNRPALLIQNDDFQEADEPWKEPLDEARPSIRGRIPSVGRIEIVSNGQTRMVATGFLVGDGLVMTNRHVVECIAVADPTQNNRWKLNGALAPQINFKAEHNMPATRIFPILDQPIYTHPTLDLGLLHINGGPLKLKVAASEPNLTQSKNMYIVGYPASDNEGIIPASVMNDIFAGIYGYKRLAPGMLTAQFNGIFAHDCSTLGGNSGSCVVDLDSQTIVGLHYSGSYRKTNYAVSLWKLTADPLLTSEGVNFD